MAVRLSSGSHRAHSHAEIRPTAARTLESVFNILQEEIPDRTVLDLFAGIGSYGIMALRRGAQSALFVDSSREAERRTVKAIMQFHLEEQATMYREDVSHFLHRAEREQLKFDLVFADPPYAALTPAQVIQEILDMHVLAENGILVFEHSSHQAPPVFEELILRKSRVFGETTVSIWDDPVSAISIRAIGKSFGEVAALRGVDLEIGEGEFYGLLGPNGAGKTTLLRVLSGILAPNSGSITILGRDLSHWKHTPVLGIVPQDIALYDVLSARRNLAIFGAVLGLRGAELSKRIDSLLDLVGLTQHCDRKVKTFSGGMKRRLNLAAGLLHDPQILLLDEPTVGVDPQSRVKIFALLNELHDTGKTLIYTTHYMEEAERLCDRIGIIDRGSLIAEGPLSELLVKVDLPRRVRVHSASASALNMSIADSVVEHDYVDYVPHKPDELGQIVSRIELSGIAYDRMEIIGPNLETLFLQLTGKELRDV